MISFYKAALCVLVAVILCLVLNRQGKEFTMLLSILVCSMVFLIMAGYLQPILSFSTRLRALGQVNSETFQILLKCTGIGLLGELVAVICQDSGNNSLSKSLNLLSTSVIIWLALPLFEQLLNLVEKILGEI